MCVHARVCVYVRVYDSVYVTVALKMQGEVGQFEMSESDA